MECPKCNKGTIKILKEMRSCGGLQGLICNECLTFFFENEQGEIVDAEMAEAKKEADSMLSDGEGDESIRLLINDAHDYQPKNLMTPKEVNEQIEEIKQALLIDFERGDKLYRKLDRCDKSSIETDLRFEYLETVIEYREARASAKSFFESGMLVVKLLEFSDLKGFRALDHTLLGSLLEKVAHVKKTLQLASSKLHVVAEKMNI